MVRNTYSSYAFLLISFAYPYLRALNISKTDVSDSGLRWLCCGTGERNSPSPGGCLLLESLFVRESRKRVTEIGVKLAIANLSKLKFLDFEFPLATTDSRGVALPAATMVSFHSSRLGHFRILNMLSLSPNVNTSYCIKQRNISDLNLAGADDIMTPFWNEWNRRPTISFWGGVVPYLLRFGQSIQSLHLELMERVDPFFILSTFPCLKSLNFDGNISYISSIPPPTPLQLSLEQFNYFGLPYSDVPIGSFELLAILKSPNLKEIKIMRCSTLSNAILKAACEVHRFGKLERLELQQCNLLTMDGFSAVFLNGCRSLKSVYLRNCEHLVNVVGAADWLALQSKDKHWLFSSAYAFFHTEIVWIETCNHTLHSVN